jgi:hypothetical protein
MSRTDSPREDGEDLVSNPTKRRSRGQQAARPDDLLLGPGASKQLIDQLIRELIAPNRYGGVTALERPLRMLV